MFFKKDDQENGGSGGPLAWGLEGKQDGIPIPASLLLSLARRGTVDVGTSPSQGDSIDGASRFVGATRPFPGHPGKGGQAHEVSLCFSGQSVFGAGPKK